MGWGNLKQCVEEMCRRGGSEPLARNVASPGDQAINVENYRSLVILEPDWRCIQVLTG